MGITRTQLSFERDFVQIPNAWLRDARLSLRARGLLAQLMTHSAGWHITIASLQRSGPEGRDAIRGAVQELVSAGYLARRQTQGAHGRFNEIEYEITDPAEGASADLTVVGKSDTGGFAVVGPADDGPADVGESDTKNTKVQKTSVKNTTREEGATAPLSPFCSKHPNGTANGEPCGACGTARLRYQQHENAAKSKPTPVPRLDEQSFCTSHPSYPLELDGSCTRCERDSADEAARAAESGVAA